MCYYLRVEWGTNELIKDLKDFWGIISGWNEELIEVVKVRFTSKKNHKYFEEYF